MKCFAPGQSELFGPLPVVPGALSVSVTDYPVSTAAVCILKPDKQLLCLKKDGGEFVIDNVQAAATGQLGVCFADGMAIRCEQTPRPETPVLGAPIEAPGTFTKLVMGHEMLYALRDDGFLVQHGHFVGTFPDEPYLDVVASGFVSCVLRTDGSVQCLRDVPVPDGLQGPYRRIALAHFDSVCGIRLDGTIACWAGPNGLVFPAPEGEFTQIAATRNEMCAVRTDGAITCFGTTERDYSWVPEGW
jgi:hypothetical protein